MTKVAKLTKIDLKIHERRLAWTKKYAVKPAVIILPATESEIDSKKCDNQTIFYKTLPGPSPVYILGKPYFRKSNQRVVYINNRRVSFQWTTS